MRGCLGSIFRLIVLALVIYALYSLGAIDFIKEKISDITPSRSEKIEKAKELLDFSDIDEEYKINKNLSFFKNRMITAEHGATGQKMIIIEAAKGDLLSKEDISGDGLKEKLDNISQKAQNKILRFEEIEILKKGNMYGISQEIPYAKFKAGVSNLPFNEIEGIIGVATVPDGKNLTLISYNQKGKYSQIITDAFFKRVK